MTETSRRATTKAITTRLDQATHDRLLELSKESQENVAEIVRVLIARALDGGAATDLLTQVIGLQARLVAVEKLLKTLPLLPLIHERLVGLELLVHAIGVAAGSQREIDREVGWQQWSAVQSDLMEVQNGLFATFEAARALDGKSRADCLGFYEELRRGSKEDFLAFRTRLQGRCAELATATPSAPQPRPLSRQEREALARCGTGSTQPADPAEERDESQPTLFDETGHGGPTKASDATACKPRQANGRGEAVR